MCDFGPCATCGKEFTDEAWDDRHSRSDGEDVHVACCDVCHPTNEPATWQQPPHLTHV